MLSGLELTTLRFQGEYGTCLQVLLSNFEMVNTFVYKLQLWYIPQFTIFLFIRVITKDNNRLLMEHGIKRIEVMMIK